MRDSLSQQLNRLEDELLAQANHLAVLESKLDHLTELLGQLLAPEPVPEPPKESA